MDCTHSKVNLSIVVYVFISGVDNGFFFSGTYFIVLVLRKYATEKNVSVLWQGR